MTAFICIGFLVGGLFGARLATPLSNAVLEKVFGEVILAIVHKSITSSDAPNLIFLLKAGRKALGWKISNSVLDRAIVKGPLSMKC